MSTITHIRFDTIIHLHRFFGVVSFPLFEMCCAQYTQSLFISNALTVKCYTRCFLKIVFLPS